jgi:hypothetical protein
MARTGPAMTRSKDRYQPRAASASQPKTLKTYPCALSDNAHCEKDLFFTAAALRHNTIKALITGNQFLRPEIALHLDY